MQQRELIVDNFAGGGGASLGMQLGTGEHVDHAINHDEIALAMHHANHPNTRHWNESVWDVDPLELSGGKPVGLAWFSPDCRHFSKAKGGKPVEKKIRGLAWVVLKWIGKVRPRVIMLENVKEFMTWGPLVDGKPCPKRKGQEFNAFINAIKRHGYQVDYRELSACDYGAPTTRTRFFMVARCDGRPIAWPQKTHGAPDDNQVKIGNKQPWRTAAEIIDWSIPVPSIFGRKKPLATNTLNRIWRGVEKFVINDPKPFIVRIGQTGFGGGGKSALTCAFLAKHYTGATGSSLEEPVHTITSTDHNALVVARLHKAEEVRAFIMKFYGTNVGLSCNEPLHTVTSKDRFALVTIRGVEYEIVDIGMRMLQPHELYAAQGFPLDYQFAIDFNGKRLSKAEQVKKCGNSVPPPVVRALVEANYASIAGAAQISNRR